MSPTLLTPMYCSLCSLFSTCCPLVSSDGEPNHYGLIIVLSSAHELVLEVFQALTSNTQIVKESIQKGIEAIITKL